MSNQIEQVLKEIRELTEAVREAHQHKDPVLDWERVKQEFSEQLNELVAAQVAEREKALREELEALKNAPIFRQGVLGQAVPEVAGKYAPLVRQIAEEGRAVAYGTEIKASDLYLAYLLLERAHAQDPQRAEPPSDDLKAAIKAMTAGGAGTGAELVPTGMAAELWEDIFLNVRVAGSITRINMPTNPFEIPQGLGQTTWRKGAEATATTATNLSTAKTTLTATELVTEVDWSYTLDEDAVVALMPSVRASLVRDGAEIIDDFILNADSTTAATGNINSDDAAPPSDAYYLSEGQDGIRHLWLVDNTAQGVNAGGLSLNDTHIRSALAKMGKYAASPDRVVMVTDVSTYLNGFLALDNTLTVDKFGPNAVVLTGQLAAYRGVPIIVSAVHRLAEADGKLSSTASNNTLGSVSIYHRDFWRVGFRRDLLIEVDRDIQKRLFIMVVSLRIAVAAHGTRTSATHTAGIYNIAV